MPAIERDRTFIGKAQRQLVGHAEVRAQLGPHAPARTVERHLAVLPFAGEIADILHAGDLLSHGKAGMHDLHARRKGEDIVDLQGHGGHEGKGLEIDVGQVVAPRPVVGEFIAEAETREQAQAQPEAVVQLMGDVRVRCSPDVRFCGRGGMAAVGEVQIDGAHGRDGGKTAHDVCARQLGDARRIVGDGRGVIRTPHHAACQRQAPRAPFRQGEAFGPCRRHLACPQKTDREHDIQFFHIHPPQKQSEHDKSTARSIHRRTATYHYARWQYF